MDPHSPYNPPEPHRSAFGALPALSPTDAEIFKEASTFNSYYMDRMLHDFGQKPQRDFGKLGESGRAHTRALYDGDCNYVDEQMARLFESILKQWPNTIFVVTADHGEELWDHGNVGHGKTLYQELVHVPLVVLAPNAAAREVDTRVESIDLLPTIADLAGLQRNPNWQGRSLVQEDIPARPVFSETDGSFVEAGLSLEAVIDGDKKLIRDRNDTAQLFDLRTDPSEQKNLIESAPDVKARLQNLLDEHNTACLAHPLAKHPPTRTALDPDMLEKLRALGYTDSPK
jgi:arylsulfatase A-like enzyme